MNQPDAKEAAPFFQAQALGQRLGVHIPAPDVDIPRREVLGNLPGGPVPYGDSHRGYAAVPRAWVRYSPDVEPRPFLKSSQQLAAERGFIPLDGSQRRAEPETPSGERRDALGQIGMTVADVGQVVDGSRHPVQPFMVLGAGP